VVKYIVAVANTFIVVVKQIVHYHPLMDAIKNG
jgi:hypothetical protein